MQKEVGDEWKVVRTTLSKHVPSVDVELNIDKVVVLKTSWAITIGDYNNGGTNIFIAPLMLGRQVPNSFAVKRYGIICLVLCPSRAPLTFVWSVERFAERFWNIKVENSH